MEVRATLKRDGRGLAGWVEGAASLVSAILIYSINAVVGVATTYLQSHITLHGAKYVTGHLNCGFSEFPSLPQLRQHFSEKSKKV